MSGWIGGLAEWEEGETTFLSVGFTWKLNEAYSRAQFAKAQGRRVVAGGPGLFLVKMKHILADVAEVGESFPDAIFRHNPNATFASRGCPVGCWFCIVPKMEGKEFKLMPDFPVRPILCDNNLSALPVKYQEHIISKYKASGIPLLDANSGFEPMTFDGGTYERWKEINKGPWRFAYDETKEREQVLKTMKILKDVYRNHKRVYVLIGNEPFEDCMARIQEVIDNGCDPHVQPFIPLNSLQREPQVRFNWTVQMLKDVARWSNAWIWKKCSFKEYDRSKKSDTGEIYDEKQGLFTFANQAVKE